MHAGGRTGIFSCKRRLMPIVIVVIDEGHEPHAPFRRRYTIGPSISASSTLPPSAGATGTQHINQRNLHHNSLATVATLLYVPNYSSKPGPSKQGQKQGTQ